jgi:hypothetical protein
MKGLFPMTQANRKHSMPSTPFRALTPFETLPAGHATFRVDDDGSAPHLNVDEYAVIDTNDRELQHGELYLYQSNCGPRDRSIVQAKIARSVTMEDDPSGTVWSTRQLRGFRKTGRDDLGIPLFTGACGGHYSAEELRAHLVGRVVGVSMDPLDNLLALTAGWINEAACNAAFDECEYVDVLIAAGYKLLVTREGYWEMKPDRPLTEAQRKIVFAHKEKQCAASTADERIEAECIRRGLIG